ncbi:cytochrome P450 [Xylariales sp. PMI_506]|nr:cytochrome P450 [Xylariales sp. PMI_506]
MTDPAQHKARFRPVAALFAKRHYDNREPELQKTVEQFSSLLSQHAQRRQPCSLALGYCALVMQIVNEFIFSSIPDEYSTMNSGKFDDPLTVSMFVTVNWTIWFSRNFPKIHAFFYQLPKPLIALVTTDFIPRQRVEEIFDALVRHEKDPKTPKREDSMMQRMINADLTGIQTEPFSDAVLATEAMMTMFGGVLDLTNILSFGTFMVSQDSDLQQGVYDELKAAWPNPRDTVPSYEVLRQLPLLNGICKESMRLTHGVVTGPARLIGPGGARVDGYQIPGDVVVAAPSYFVHMDPTVFPNPDKFDPKRWLDQDNSSSVVIFSKGRRMCPAAHLSTMEMFAGFAAVFRRFLVTPYETSVEDFAWNQYFSIIFTGRPLQAILEERTE